MVYFLIEFVDELVFGVVEASWPLIRNELALNYFQIGLALSLPGLLANFIEPFLFILGDLWKRRAMILLGGVFFTASLLLTGVSYSFLVLMFSFILFNPSSGAFVSLSQASLMDVAPARQEQSMARWTVAGSLGVVLGPILLGGLAYFGSGWRPAFWILAALSVTPQARTLAADRGISWVELDYEALRGMEGRSPRLFEVCSRHRRTGARLRAGIPGRSRWRDGAAWPGPGPRSGGSAPGSGRTACPRRTGCGGRFRPGRSGAR